MKILQLMKWLPLREDSGGRIRAARLGRSLASFAGVDAMGFVAPGEAIDANPRRHEHYDRLFPIPLPPSHKRLGRTLAGFAAGLSLRSSRFFDREMVRSLTMAVREGHYDAVQAEELPMMSIARALSPDVPVVYSAYNVESELSSGLVSRRGVPLGPAARIEKQRTRDEERSALAHSAFCLTVSEKDKDALRRLGAEIDVPIHVLPNCAPDHFVPEPEAVRESDILVVGSFGWYPNWEGLRWFTNRILPLVRERKAGVRVLVAGSGLSRGRRREIESRAVEVRPDVHDMLPLFRRSRMLVVPVRVGGGTRIKIMEAWAAGLPVISTSIGIEGHDHRSGEDCLVADDPAALRDAVIRLLEDPILHARLRAAGLKNVRGHRWSDLTPELERAYLEALSGRENGRA
jgi:glycosyltransferase involved in cell wall biosynthesis